MGGLFGSTPEAPIQDNSAQLQMLQQQSEQNIMMMEQQRLTMQQQQEADAAMTEQQSMLAQREAQEEIERNEREDRMRKGKSDLLYKNALGAIDEEEEELGSGLLKLGGE